MPLALLLPLALFLTAPAMPSLAQAPLTTLAAIHALSNQQASAQLPVDFEATVTYYKTTDVDLFVQDGDIAIYLPYKPGESLTVGDRVHILGKTKDSYRPIVVPSSITRLHPGTLPNPVSIEFRQLVSSQFDCRLIKVRGLVRSADLVGPHDPPGISLHMVLDGGIADASLNSTDQSMLPRLVGAQVEITGIAGAEFDQRNQLTGARINVQNIADVRILKPAEVDPLKLPFASFDGIFSSYHDQNTTTRVHVQGVITYYQPGSTLVIQTGDKSLWASTRTYQPLTIGHIADVTGYPEIRNSYLTLADSEVVDTGRPGAVTPITVSAHDLGFGGNAFRLVTTDAKIVRQVREAAVDEYVLDANGYIFSAIYRQPPVPDGDSNQTLFPPMRTIPVGATIRVTGIGMFYTADPFDGPVASDILLRSPDDIVILAPAPWLDLRHMAMLAGLLLLLVLVVLTRGWLLERRIRRQSEEYALNEQHRSRILEHINGGSPLATVLEEIASLTANRLKASYCWCQVVEKSTVGNTPPESATVRIVGQEIRSGLGSLLGNIFAAFPASIRPRAEEQEFLATAAYLAALALETQRLNHELRYRSEFDQLTDIRNRFSFGLHLDALIARAREDASIFALIYIDLDDFKLVNDLHGHRIGDRYLQEVANRMKGQLRSADVLARLGGDEFAALAPSIHNRAEAEEIVNRIAGCFAQPFLLEGISIVGSASIGLALYPEDGLTGDSLLNAADVQMYLTKRTRTAGNSWESRPR